MPSDDRTVAVEHRDRDTSPAAEAEYLDRLRAMPGRERLLRALALSALARELAWQGALRTTEGRDREAAVRQFVRKVHGEALAQFWERVTSTPSA